MPCATHVQAACLHACQSVLVNLRVLCVQHVCVCHLSVAASCTRPFPFTKHSVILCSRAEGMHTRDVQAQTSGIPFALPHSSSSACNNQSLPLMSLQEQKSVQAVGGISLFAKHSRKRRKKGAAAVPTASTDVPITVSAAASVDDPQAGIAEDAGEGGAAAQRQSPAGISGRDDTDEDCQGFRSLGVSEWLDRYVCSGDLAYAAR